MTRKPFAQVALLLACGALAAGCGGGARPATSTTGSGVASSASASTSSSATTESSATTTTSSSAGSASTTTASTTTASTTTATSGAPAPASPSQGLSAEVAVCRREVASAAANALTAAERSQLNDVCTLAGSRNLARLRTAERQVCRTVIKDTAPGLSGPAVAAAEQTCDRL